MVRTLCELFTCGEPVTVPGEQGEVVDIQARYRREAGFRSCTNSVEVGPFYGHLVHLYRTRLLGEF